MNSTSRYALLAALGLAIAAISPGSPAFAKKKEDAAPAAPVLKLSDALRKELAPTQAAIEKKDIAGADAGLAKARAVAKTPDEQYTVAQFGLNIAQISGDQARLATALDELIATGEAAHQLTPDNRAKFYWYQGQFAYVAKNYPKAEAALSQAIAAGSTEADAPVLLSDSQYRDGKAADAVATLQKALDAKAAAGQPVPSEWYARGADMASRAKLPNDFVKISTAWLIAYPEPQNWHDSLFIYRQLAAMAGEPDVDLLRLARAVGALPLAAQSNYTDYALGVYLRYPNEAVDVLNEGIKAGKVTPASSQNAREILTLSQPKLTADKASVPAAVTAANGPKATYKSVVTTGDLLYGYKDFARAADMYKLSLTKPGADTNQANFRLGLALAQTGDKAGARAAFGAVTSGPYAALAAFGKAWIAKG